MSSLNYLISVAFDLYIMVVILRIWLQAVRADFYNPFSQFIVKATQPVVAPLRRVIPSIGSIDLATLLLAYALCVAKFIILILVDRGILAFNVEFLLFGLLTLVKEAGGLLFWILLLRAILSWVSQGRSPVEYVFHQLTEPMLAPIRRIIPVMGGLDLSVLVLFIALQFANKLMGDIFGLVWTSL